MTRFIRLIDVPREEKEKALRNEARQQGNKSWEIDPCAFQAIPGSPFVYWASATLRHAFLVHAPFNSGDRFAVSGGKTLDDFRFVRLWWEIKTGTAWPPYSKGGSFSSFYDDVYLCVNWSRGAAALKAFLIEYRSVRGWSPHWTAELHGSEHYFRAGLTWPRRPHRQGSFRVLPKGCVFGSDGPAAFAGDILPVIAVANSSTFLYLLNLLMARGTEGGQTLKYEIGYVASVPLPTLDARQSEELRELSVRAWRVRRALDECNETSHAFLFPSRYCVQILARDRHSLEAELQEIQIRIDEAAYSIYNINQTDRAIIEMASRRVRCNNASSTYKFDEDEVEGGSDALRAAEDSIISWIAGISFGHFDPRLATGERPIPPEPEPFDPLPTRSPGMFPQSEEPTDRPDILVDDEGHADDLAARAQVAAERVGVDVPENLRAWLAREFFPLHIKMYSKSRRKAPIYWQLATPSASYSVWLYIHAFSRDTLLRVQDDYATPKLAHEERRLESLTSELRDKSTAAERKELAAQEAFVEELRGLLEEVKRVAPLWNPNLDDGVIINFAPLWRLVSQNNAWQRELKSTWEALCAGKYDWAHLSMHLWPERVVPKCATDRSLAIAHGLEDVLWVEGADGKWAPRKTLTRSLEELVRERTSPAVKAALKSLLEAPAAIRRGGSRRRTPAAVGGAA